MHHSKRLRAILTHNRNRILAIIHIPRTDICILEVWELDITISIVVVHVVSPVELRPCTLVCSNGSSPWRDFDSTSTTASARERPGPGGLRIRLHWAHACPWVAERVTRCA